MKYEELLKNRRSIRDYLDKKVEIALVKEILQDACLSPSHCNLQPWRFIVIQDKSLMKRISDECRKGLLSHIEKNPAGFFKRFENTLKKSRFNIFYNAPTLVMIVGKKDQLFLREDLALCAAYFMFAATARNLGTCYIGLAQDINNLNLKKEIGIEEGEEIIVSIIIGYPQNSPIAPERIAPEIKVIC